MPVMSTQVTGVFVPGNTMVVEMVVGGSLRLRASFSATASGTRSKLQ